MPYIDKIQVGNTSYDIKVSIIDATAATSIGSSSADPITARGVYYGLPTINGTHTYNSATNFYVPTTAGTAGQVLTSNGSGAPIWAAASSSSDVVVAQGSEPQSEDTLIWIDTSSN